MLKQIKVLFASVGVIAAIGCADQKPIKPLAQQGGPDSSQLLWDVRVQFIRQSPTLDDAELEAVRHTRETISHYFENPNNFYISSVTVAVNSIEIAVAPLDRLQSDYRLYFASKGPESGRTTVMADDRFNPVYFQFNRNYELQKCVNNWGQDCKPIW